MHTFKPKIPLWVNVGGPCSGRCWFILWPFGIFYGHLAFGLFYGNLGIFGPVLHTLVLCNKKNLATLEHMPPLVKNKSCA
jgi:hypothetical protein